MEDDVTHKLDDKTAAFVRENMPRMLEAAMDLRTPAERQLDKYGVALMMIREGCANPADVARRVLAEFGK
jgi:hypothetical protein